MSKWKAALPAIVIVLAAGYAIPSLLDAPSSFHRQQPESPQKIVQDFLRAVDRGELVLFVYTLHRSYLIPRRVEYVYELDSPTPSVTVHCDLKEPLPVPGQPELEVRAISAELDPYGSIVVTRGHVYGRQDTETDSEGER